VRRSLVRAQLDDAVHQEQPHNHISLRDVRCTAIPARLGAVPRPVPGVVAVVAGVIAVRPAIAAGITSFVLAPAAGVACAAFAISLGLALPSTMGSATPLLALLGCGSVVPLLAAGASLLGVQ